jgi:hypothetical protein
VPALNYRVLGGTQSPENPRENDIWVNTSADITDHVLSLDEPEKVEGRVWFLTATTSTVKINALKKNVLMVYPTRARQCVDGAWVTVPFQAWLDGAWKEPTIYLFKAGDQCVHLTGGWSGVDPDAAVLYLYKTDKTDYGISVNTRTLMPVDVSSYSSLIVMVDSFGELFKVSLVDSTGNKVAERTLTSLPTGGLVKLDISQISGSYYIELYAHSNSHGTEGNSYATAYFTVTSVSME